MSYALASGAERVVATTMAVNTASRRVLEKAGPRYVRTWFGEWDGPLPGSEHGDVDYELDCTDKVSNHGGPDRARDGKSG